MFENKKIFILGMARSGYEAAKLLAKHNNTILITDRKEQKEDIIKKNLDEGMLYRKIPKPSKHIFPFGKIDKQQISEC